MPGQPSLSARSATRFPRLLFLFPSATLFTFLPSPTSISLSPPAFSSATPNSSYVLRKFASFVLCIDQHLRSLFTFPLETVFCPLACSKFLLFFYIPIYINRGLFLCYCEFLDIVICDSPTLHVLLLFDFSSKKQVKN